MPTVPDSLAAALADTYRVDRELGAGGMATVYLGHDLKHDRDVAIKVLHPDLGAALGAERFLSEIRTTAKLQHPHILPLLDSGSAEDATHRGPPWLFYVMPLVVGETLRERLVRERQLPIADAVRIAREIASALDYAHRQGVIHRDIKPENILLHDGQALVADFGIALAVQSAGGARLTQTGLSLGTPQYMSPEQAMGERAIDARSDVYALGAVTYEMLTGEPPFTGATVQAIVAKVLTERPVAVSTTRDMVPAGVERAVLTALAKLPADRFGTAREFSEALERQGTAESPSVGVNAAGWRAQAGRVRAWQVATGALSAVAVVAIIAAGIALRASSAAHGVADAAPVIRAHFDLPPGARIADALSGTTIAVSPKGDLIAFTSVTVGGYHMYLRRVNELAAREIADRSMAGRNLTFSPDGRWLAFTEGNVLRKLAVDGGAPVTVGTTGSSVPYGLSWSAADTIYTGSFSGMFAIPASGGTPAPVARSDSAALRLGQRWPLVLPGGGAVAYSRGNSSSAPAQLSVVELTTGHVSDYTLQVSMSLGVIDDQLVYVSATGELMAVRIDVRSGRPLADPVMLDEGVLVDPTGGAKASLSPSGTLVFLRGRAQVQPVRVSPSRTAMPLLDDLRSYSNPRYSPDGRRVALVVYGASSNDVWIYDVGRNTFSRLTTAGSNVRPEWTSDGKSVVFISERAGRAGIWRQPADGSGAAELLYEPEQEPFEAIVSPDTKWLVFRTAPGLVFPRDILAIPFPSTRAGGPLGTLPAKPLVTQLVTGPNTESQPRFSPDGKWLAYQTNESGGRFEVFVRPFPSNAGRVQVSTDGGAEPIWGRDGRSLYYRGPLGQVVRATVTTGNSFTIGARKIVLTDEYLTDSSHPSWDVAPDGSFLMLKRTGEESQMIVAHGWARELRARAAGRR